MDVRVMGAFLNISEVSAATLKSFLLKASSADAKQAQGVRVNPARDHKIAQGLSRVFALTCNTPHGNEIVAACVSGSGLHE